MKLRQRKESVAGAQFFGYYVLATALFYAIGYDKLLAVVVGNMPSGTGQGLVGPLGMRQIYRQRFRLWLRLAAHDSPGRSDYGFRFGVDDTELCFHARYVIQIPNGVVDRKIQLILRKILGAGHLCLAGPAYLLVAILQAIGQ